MTPPTSERERSADDVMTARDLVAEYGLAPRVAESIVRSLLRQGKGVPSPTRDDPPGSPTRHARCTACRRSWWRAGRCKRYSPAAPVTAADLKVRDIGSPVTRESGWWAAWCKHCGRLITKYEFTRDDCISTALACSHECKAPGQMGLL